ncbi:dethiobiotin synthase [Methylophaga sp.]|uniref:dethiobiotin synthase n=1 Tax=Methylophaga sp. TaxID=2024840 RepID=UPI0013FF43BA|nr:dethiobiotin synthase [Methylophaga sp.]MTI63222.1 dethiobiotin synthase [Methylophaga sp.]
MIPKHVFVTGTDTEVGKTRISTGLMGLLRHQGVSVAGMKPVASGCHWIEGQWQNEDALAMIAQSNVSLPYSLINPYAFEPAIAPHIAAGRVNTEVSISDIKQQFERIKAVSDAVVVEGAGGWLVPLNQTETMADLAVALDLPVVLVVAIKLGCINHALLSVESIQQRGLKIAGWVANHLDEQGESAEIIETLKQHIAAPCLGVVPRLAEGQSAAEYLCQEG